MLREWFGNEGISASAFSQARDKIRHTAFIELLEKGVVDVMYGEGTYEKFKGYRLLAIDGSSLRLPNTEETRAHFGVVTHLNGNKTEHCIQVEAKMSVLYDVLNRIPLSAQLHKGRTNDLKASKVHLSTLKEGDLVLADRAYGSYQFFAEILEKKADFIIRCKHKSFEKYHGLFSKETKKDEIIAEVTIPYAISKNVELPRSLSLRFVRIELEGGEIEILATSLLDTKKFLVKEFKKTLFLTLEN